MKKQSDMFGDLKTCPFCSGKAIVKADPWMSVYGEDVEKYYVVCRCCGSRTGRYSKMKAIESWNRRKERAS